MPMELPRDPARKLVAQNLDKFTRQVESLRDSGSPPNVLVTQILQTSPASRPSAMEVLQHPWLAPQQLDEGIPVLSPLEPLVPTQIDDVVAAALVPALPSSGELPPPLVHTAAVPSSGELPPHLPTSGVHPKLINIMKPAELIPHLVPGDLTAFLKAVKSLGQHEGNLMLHVILAISKYPTVLEDLAPRLAKLPTRLTARTCVCPREL